MPLVIHLTQTTLTELMELTDEDIVERLLFGEEFIPTPCIEDIEAIWTSTAAETRSDDSSDSKEPIPPKRKRQRTSLKHEIEYLREKQNELQKRLNELESTTQLKPPASIWETRAKDQMMAAQRAIHENTMLRGLLQEQLKTAQTLERVLKRKPKLELTPDFTLDAWRTWRLTTDPDERLHSMHSITDHIYGKLESEFIKNNVYDLRDGQSGLTLRTTDNVLWFDFMQSMVIDMAYPKMQELTWMLARYKVELGKGKMLHTRGEVIENLSDSMAYIRTYSTVSIKDTICRSEGRLVVRKYIESTRSVFVYRSILDDPQEPHGESILRDNMIGWIVLEPCPINPLKTIQYFMHQCTPATSSDFDTPVPQGELTELILQMLKHHMDQVKELILNKKKMN